MLLNPETIEIEEIPESLFDDLTSSLFFSEVDENIEPKHEKWQHCITIGPMQSSESFKVMKYFVGELDDEKLQQKLIQALRNRKPIANFKWLIDNSDYRQQWFNFRQKEYEAYVWPNIEYDLEKFIKNQFTDLYFLNFRFIIQR